MRQNRLHSGVAREVDAASVAAASNPFKRPF